MQLTMERTLVFAGAFAIATVHFGRLADAVPKPETEAETPASVPVEAMVTGREIASADVDGLSLRLAREDGKMVLTVMNPTDAAKRVDWDVDCASIRGSMVSRMGPMTIPAETKHLSLSVRARSSERIELASPAPADPEAPPAIMPIDTYRVLVLPHSEERMRTLAASAEPDEAASRDRRAAGWDARTNGTRQRLGGVEAPLAFLQLEG